MRAFPPAADFRRGSTRRGSALVIVMIIMVVVIVLCLATLALSSSETKSAAVEKQRLQALFAAEAGVELMIADLKEMTTKAGLVSPFSAIDRLEGTTTYSAETLTKDGQSVGQFTVTVTDVEAVDDGTRDVTIRSVGCVPAADHPGCASRTVTATVRLQLARSSVFDYVYFINNWGWFYGNTIYARGNVRSNGQFDSSTYRPKIDGVPRYERVVGTDLQNRLDEGGIYAGWDIIADNIRGSANRKWTWGDAQRGLCDPEDVGQYKYQYPFLEQLPMPNLTDLSLYEEIARSNIPVV